MTFENESQVAEWIESVDEQYTQRADIQEELESAWLVVYGHPLSEESDDMQADAWSHLCAAVL